ncbi:MAG TPA: hypothetical protein VKM55_30180 [Candidatus Lokiarchaeia archaeon]|nr:hypothetical protein [Candidatus Lokiarchaeia archaeon]
MDKENDYCYDPQHYTYDTEDPAFLFLESKKTEYSYPKLARWY